MPLVRGSVADSAACCLLALINFHEMGHACWTADGAHAYMITDNDPLTNKFITHNNINWYCALPWASAQCLLLRLHASQTIANARWLAIAATATPPPTLPSTATSILSLTSCVCCTPLVALHGDPPVDRSAAFLAGVIEGILQGADFVRATNVQNQPSQCVLCVAFGSAFCIVCGFYGRSIGVFLVRVDEAESTRVRIELPPHVCIGRLVGCCADCNSASRSEPARRQSRPNSVSVCQWVDATGSGSKRITAHV